MQGHKKYLSVTVISSFFKFGMIHIALMFHYQSFPALLAKVAPILTKISSLFR